MSLWENLKALLVGPAPIEAVFKQEWVAYLEQNLPLYTRLPEGLKHSLHEKIGLFVATTYFEGCNELELTDEMILTVAAQACILVLNHQGSPYPKLNSVLLYPTTFSSSVQDMGPGGTIIERTVHRLGESWGSGTVILAWDSVRHGARNIYDGHNVTFHEFAHQLDSLNGSTDGVPPLGSQEAFVTWCQVLNDGYDQLAKKAAYGKKAVLDHYGATNPAEYFAVATEAFFEKPKQLQTKRPELYATLQEYYQLDPREWFQAEPTHRFMPGDGVSHT